MNIVLKIKNLLFKEISEGEYIPLGYGVSYKRYGVLKIVCSPTPLTILIRIFREFYYVILRGLFKSKKELEKIKGV